MNVAVAAGVFVLIGVFVLEGVAVRDGSAVGVAVGVCVVVELDAPAVADAGLPLVSKFSAPEVVSS